MNEFHPKLDPKKVKQGDEDSAFEQIGKTYAQYTKVLEKFHELKPNQQRDFIAGFGKDLNTLLLILQEYTLQRTDDVTDRGNQI